MLESSLKQGFGLCLSIAADFMFFFFHFFWIKVLLLILPGIVLMENSSMRLIHYNKISFWKKIPVFSTKYEIITKITNAETEK